MVGWSERKEAAEARGEAFDEPQPGSAEARRRKREALEKKFMYRLQRHWIWPHIMILALVCLVIDIVALGIWDRMGSKVHRRHRRKWHSVLITMGSLLAVGAYWLLYKFFRWFFRFNEQESGAEIAQRPQGRHYAEFHWHRKTSHPVKSFAMLDITSK